MVEGEKAHDIGQILAEAQHRWLRPGEICELLRNHQRFRLTSDPPYKPPGGSLFLFDRKTLRYFRKDGHNWRKKKDGKTIREAHEKLKAGSVDVLHCYYAHGEENENFQRRSYWMLDELLQHIVLVHYREVNEGSRSAIPRLLNADGGMQNDGGSASTSLVPSSSAQVNSPVLTAHASYASSPSTTHWNGRAPSSEFDDGDSGDDFGVSSLGEPTTAGFGVGSLHPNDTAKENTLGCTGPVHLPYESKGLNDLIGVKNGPINPFYMNQVDHSNLISDRVLQTNYGVSREAGLLGGLHFGLATGSSSWPETHSSNKDRTAIHVQRIDHAPLKEKSPELTLDPYSINKHGLDGEHGPFSDAQLQLSRRNTQKSIQEQRNEVNAVTADFPSNNSTINDLPKIYESTRKQNFYSVNPSQENKIGSTMKVSVNDSSLDSLTGDGHTQKNDPKNSLYNSEQQELKKLDSFGRWMNREIGRDCDDSLMTSDSPLYWCSLGSVSNKDVSSLSSHMQLDVDSLGPSLSQDQLFSIIDFSPDWAFSGEETKVLISGTFMKNLNQYPHNMKWSCMFGEVEVPAEVLTTNALRCQAPAHVPGLVPFYITCSNRLACSEVQEFEFRERVSGLGLSSAVKIEPGEEMQLQIRFAKMLFLGIDRKQRIGCSEGNCDKCLLMMNMFSGSPEHEWHQIGRTSQQNPREALLQRLLKDRLYDWLLHKVHEEGKGPNILDDRGQGVIHLAAALGYEWAMRPIVAAGVSPSFRDARGRTGLHWAAYFGREEMVVTLVGLGAAPGAVEDPTSKFPEGQTAADLASSRGLKGIAGYLAEADLTSHLSSLRLEQIDFGSVSGNPDVAEDSVQTAKAERISSFEGSKEQQFSLRGSLAAVRNSAQAAARIQGAFRVQSFIQRQSTRISDEHSEVSNELIALASLNKTQKVGHFSDSLHAAAVRIQQKFRGWKGRKEFLNIRHRIVKIQAHVRGHQVRKQYKKVVWSVSIVEKAILRWRRKGTGLRGFRVDNAIGHSGPELGKTDEYDFLRAGRKKKEAGVEKALARVQSMARYPEARDQYMRLVQKAKMKDGGAV
ncbi:calmodulin-binding transcription activator 1-like isoform X2 [Aristolochia californica]|uniref:calmodulin-binding transcription activator 1-like isoform X2 n=1 Tax=Aristolochia californica TaxID=171875 RepID=UPI0035D58C0F